MSNTEWWSKKLKEFVDDAKPFLKIHQDVVEDKKNGHWSVIKHMLLSYFIPMYTSIITSKKNYFKNCIYVDLFAGSGIHELELSNGSVFTTGSSLAAICKSQGKFSEMIFCDKAKKKISALRARIDSIRGKYNNCKFTVTDPMDVNKVVPKVIDIIDSYGKSAHTLFFIDPFGMSLDFEKFKMILERTSSDIFLYFNSDKYMQQVNAGKKGHAPEKNNLFFGGDYWRNASSSQELYRLFKEKILPYRNLIKEFDIMKNANNVAYKIMVCTRKTRGGSPWLDRYEKWVSKRIANETGQTIRTKLEIQYGPQMTLDDYF